MRQQMWRRLLNLPTCLWSRISVSIQLHTGTWFMHPVQWVTTLCIWLVRLVLLYSWIIRLQSCPCFSECPSGCSGCQYSECTCAHPDENPDFKSCEADVNHVYVDCLKACDPGEDHCARTCAHNYNTMVKMCPCMADCPDGCPCDSYACPTDHVLAIWGNPPQAAITNSVNGDVVDIRWDAGTEDHVTAQSMCSLVFENNFYILGHGFKKC